MDNIKNIIRAFDIYGITYSFRYKNKEKYQTLSGGIIVILFLILVLIVGIYYLIPFANRKNYTIVYYTMNLASTDEVNLFQSDSNFAIGLICEENKKEKYSVHDLLDLKGQYIRYIKSSNGTYYKDRKNHSLHNCNYEDFYNKYNSSVDFLGLSKFKCLEEKTDIIQGIYTDQIFSYFEFTVSAKNDSVLKEIDRFLFENDCKLEIIYTDIIIDIDNYKKPISQYLNNIFIQLNPTLFIKRAMYFINQYFTNDDYLLFVFGDEDEKAEMKTLYSRYEEYYLEIGYNRTDTKPNNYQNYARLYLRADLKKTIIKRKYQKFMEFFADASSILVALYDILFLIFNFIDYFYAYHSLSQQIFFFKDIKEENNYNIFQKKKEIQEIIASIESKEKNIDSEIVKEDTDNKLLISNFNNKNIKTKESNKTRELFTNLDLKGIKIYSDKSSKEGNKSLTIIKSVGEKERKIKNNLIKTKDLKLKKQKTKKYENNINSKENELESEDNLQRKQISEMRDNIYNTDLLNIKYSEKANEDSKKSKVSCKEKSSSLSSESNSIKLDPDSKLEYSFNIFEILITQFFKCFMCKRIKIKNKINENANKLLNKKLDIITYIRNMILFDILHRTILDNKRNDVINLLCRPVISLKQNKNNDFSDFYKSYKKKDFEKFVNNIQDLIQKPEKEERENKLISISKDHLKEFI